MSTRKTARGADKKLHLRRERSDLLRRVRRFKRAHLFVGKRHASKRYHLSGIFLDRQRSKDRVILLHGPECDTKALCELAAKAFGRHKWKLVRLERHGHGTNEVDSGTGLVRDGSNEMGTLGGWLWNKAGDTCYGFSNHHVLVGNGAPVAGLPVWQNGVCIGGLFSWWSRKPAPALNACDMAIFKLAPGLDPYWAADPPSGTRAPGPNEPVHFHGAVSAMQGQVAGTMGDVALEMDGQLYHFTNVIAVCTGNGSPFTQPGDSGSLLMGADNKALAVLFGRSWDAQYSYAFPLANVNKLFAQYQL